MRHQLPVLLALLLTCYIDPASCQVSILSEEGTFALLAGESVTCSFVSLGSIPDEVMWSRDGVELVKIMNKLKIQNFPGSSVVTFETADAIVPGNYTCFVRFGSVEGRVTQKIVPAEYSLTVKGNADLLPGEDVLLFCNFTSNRRAKSFEWTGNGTTQMGEYLNITNVSYSDGGPYMCTVGFSLSTILTVSVDINVHDHPILSPSHTQINALERKGSNMSLNCNITGVGLKYNWTFHGEEVKKSDRISLSGLKLNIVRVVFFDAGIYTCLVKNRAGNATQFHNLTVFGSPDIIAPNSTIEYVAVNRQASLFCRSVSYPGSSTSWVHYPVNGTGTGLSVPGSNTRFRVESSEELIIMKAEMEDAGIFMCNVTNDYGNATFNITLVVVDVPLPPVISTNDITPHVTSVTLSWTQSVPSEYGKVEQFVIELSANDSPFTQWAGVIDGDQRMFTVTGLSPGVMYRLAMRSRNIAGLSFESNIVSFETTTSPPQLEFFNLTLSDDGRSILFQWRLLHDGGAPVNSFHITLQSGDIELNYDADVNANRLLVTRLEPNTKYTVSLSLSNQLGQATPVTISITTPQEASIQLITPQNACISPTSIARQVCEAASVNVSVLVASTLVSGVLAATTAAIVASIIMWCVMKKRYYTHSQSTSGRGMQDGKSGTHELTSVVYDVPVLKDRQNQTISNQDNVAYGGTMLLQ